MYAPPPKSKMHMLRSKLAHGSVTVKQEVVKQQDSNLQLTDLAPGEDWSVQLFRSIDSGADVANHLCFCWLTVEPCMQLFRSIDSGAYATRCA
jgi:hypothetical protein